MNCEIYQDLVAAHVDGVLSADEQQDVQEHLSSCQACHRLFAQQQQFQTAFRARTATFITPVPEAVEQRLHAALAEEVAAERPLSEHVKPTQAPPSSTWQQLKNWLQLGPVFPRFAVGLMAAGFVIGIVLTRFVPSDRAPTSVSTTQTLLTQAVESYHTLAEGQPDLRYTVQQPAELETTFNRSGQLNFSTRVLNFQPAGLQLRGGTINYVNDQPVAMAVYDNGDGHILCLRQHGQMPQPLAEVQRINGGYLYTHNGYTIFVSQLSDHFCTLVSRFPSDVFLRRLAMIMSHDID